MCIARVLARRASALAAESGLAVEAAEAIFAATAAWAVMETPRSLGFAL